MLTLNVKPKGILVRIVENAAGETTGYELQLLDPAMNITVGPFPVQEWEKIKGIVNDPEGAAASAEARARILQGLGPGPGREH